MHRSGVIADQQFHTPHKSYDCGSKLGYLEATVEFALKHPNLGPKFAAYLAKLAAERLSR